MLIVIALARCNLLLINLEILGLAGRLLALLLFDRDCNIKTSEILNKTLSGIISNDGSRGRKSI